MNALVDRHHADLLYSMQLTYEPTHDLFTPVGREWWDEGYWRFGTVYGDERLVAQYLVDILAPVPMSPPPREVAPGLWLMWDDHHPERPIYGITLGRAKTLSWDAVIATVDENQSGFARFAQEHGARYLYHIGNANQYIDSALNPELLEGPQRFDYQTTFRWREPVRQDRIVSFVNLLPKIPEMWEGFTGLQERLPAYSFASYGHDCPDGLLKPVGAIAEEMSRAGWAYHDKTTGDGFGHILANWAAVGRPLIGHARYYQGQWGHALWKDGETCIDLDKHSLDEAAHIVDGMSAESHREMCWAIREVLMRVL